MASVPYGKSIMASVILAKILWQMKLSHLRLCLCVTSRAWDTILVEYCISSWVLIATPVSQCGIYEPGIQSWLSLIADGLYLERYIRQLVMK